MQLTKFEKIVKTVPLHTRLLVHLQMDDIDNWKNGEYYGDRNKIDKQVNELVEIFEEFYNDGMPQEFKKID